MTHKYVKWHDPEYVEKKQKKKQTNKHNRSISLVLGDGRYGGNSLLLYI